jgi:hypothetical protein
VGGEGLRRVLLTAGPMGSVARSLRATCSSNASRARFDENVPTSADADDSSSICAPYTDSYTPPGRTEAEGRSTA